MDSNYNNDLNQGREQFKMNNSILELELIFGEFN